MCVLFLSSDDTLPSLEVEFEINGIEPEACGRFGGCTFTLSGIGLDNAVANTDIQIAGYDCDVVDTSYSTIVCSLPSFTRNLIVTNEGSHAGEIKVPFLRQLLVRIL